MPDKTERIVVDTNIFISYLISYKFSKLDDLLKDRKAKLLLSEELLNEFLEVVARPKLRKYFKSQNIVELLETITQCADLIEVKATVNVCRDKKDNFLLALCEDGQADFLVTGDQDLLILKEYKGTLIVKMADYLRQ